MKSTKLRPYSQLGFKPMVPAELGNVSREILITLHGHRQELDPLLNLGSIIAPKMRLEAPVAPRGVYQSTRIIGRTWYGGPNESPEPASFGDSLAQIEMFIHDAQQRAGTDAPKPWLLGYEQGAVLALTISLIAPEVVSGVMAIGGGLPQFSDPGLIPPVQAESPVLLIDNSAGNRPASRLQATATTLELHGRKVELSVYNDADTYSNGVRNALESWLQRQTSM